MRTYHERAAMVTAFLWRPIQPHPMVTEWPGIVEGDCRQCGRPFQEHGLLHGWRPVCARRWIVIHPHGVIEIMENRAFKKRYGRMED